MKKKYLQKEKPEIEPVPHINPIEPKEPEVIPFPEKTEPKPVPETQPLHTPEIAPSPKVLSNSQKSFKIMSSVI